jgi:hypothetical protein
MTPLITIPNRGRGLRQGPIHGAQDERHFQRLIVSSQ